MHLHRVPGHLKCGSDSAIIELPEFLWLVCIILTIDAALIKTYILRCQSVLEDRGVHPRMSYYLCCTKTCIALWSTDAARMVASSRNSTATLRCLVHVKPGKLSQSRDASVLVKRHPRTKSHGIALLMPAKNLGCWSLRQSAQLLSAGRAGYTEPGVKNVSCSKKCQDGKLVEEGKPRPSWVAIMALLFSFGAAS